MHGCIAWAGEAGSEIRETAGGPRTQERAKRRRGLKVNGLAVGGAQSFYRGGYAAAGGPGGDHGLAPPTEFSAAQMDGERVGIEAGVPAVAIGEGMDQHELMMAAHRDFVGGVGVVLDPVAGVAEQGGEAFAYFMRRDSDDFWRCGRWLPAHFEVSLNMRRCSSPDVGFDERVGLNLMPAGERPVSRPPEYFHPPLV